MTYKSLSSGGSYALNGGVLIVPNLYVLSVRKGGLILLLSCLQSSNRLKPGATEVT